MTDVVSARDKPLIFRAKLESLRNDEFGTSATFWSYPAVIGNDFSVPVSEEWAARLVPGEKYLFALVEEIHE